MNVLVFAQSEKGKIKKGSLESISAGRNIANDMKGNLILVLFEKINNAEALGGLGADKVYLIHADYNVEQYSNILANLVSKEKAHTVIIGSTILGNDLAARVAAKTGAGLLFDCRHVTAEKGVLEVKKSFESHLATLQFKSLIQVITLLPNTQPVKIFKRRKCAVENVESMGSVLKTVVKEVNREAQNKLKNAEIVVCGGYGVKEKGNFKMIELLAEKLGGTVGATHTAVEAGFADKEKQVGKRGRQINPLLYIGCGISGSKDHLKGIQNSKIIVAFNHVKDAPICKHADYCIVDDMWRALPSFINEIDRVKR
ncbi:electron transfer flavoprotein subunit alpha/FixB family protein [Candidatus Woesearchaeota archaeon]|jgi:electron transfer flavoprotein alpha subunit|nr:electron transfer flavoprotein subunit alpha/FixB family protein [Candidatus Woesearchaeota archaeon]